MSEQSHCCNSRIKNGCQIAMGEQGSTLYVSQLPANITSEEVEAAFLPYGHVRSVHLKVSDRKPPYAFVETASPLMAATIIKAKPKFDWVVELSNSGRLHVPIITVAPPSKGFRVVVAGLPLRASWQDVKDHLRKNQCLQRPFTQVNVLSTDCHIASKHHVNRTSCASRWNVRQPKRWPTATLRKAKMQQMWLHSFGRFLSKTPSALLSRSVSPCGCMT